MGIGEGGHIADQLEVGNPHPGSIRRALVDSRRRPRIKGSANMELKGQALLVYRDDGVFDELRQALQSLGLEAVRVSNCKELQSRLHGVGDFFKIFTEARLPDGEYRDVCRIAARPLMPLPVIVVCRFVDMDLYLDSMENGASDFIVPPFLCTDIAHVLMTAINDG
jgi:DNA-binding NtrC family response regulator